MKYAEFPRNDRIMHVAFEPTNFGLPYMKLFRLTDTGGYDVWDLERQNNFRNEFQQAGHALYEKMTIWGEIFRDVIPKQPAQKDGKNRLILNYISHAGTERHKECRPLVPENGWYVPTNDGMFYTDTLIPYETVKSKKEAMRRWEEKGLNRYRVSRFERIESYENGERLVGRICCPISDMYGWFSVSIHGMPTRSDTWVGSRTRIELVTFHL